ncbi:PREDICTED: berberine bridge enzyme-like 17 [Lupinus angustifolius]|uniref:berberine bridge enzyme-like 17 n=1 Tax=Lupinus angustifolius TaxID=3871 RepID=UPI00092FC417|nr:PREDICTED: berberine bridge enzyme-like 17 [Lupinus angustifolius]
MTKIHFSVPAKVTIFTVNKFVEDGAADVLYKWQEVAPNLDEDLFIRVEHSVVDGTKGGKKKVKVAFIGEFLGTIDKLLPLVSKSFPELGLRKSDCIEMPWINSTLYWDRIPIGTPLETLLTTPKEPMTIYFKSKSDYIKKPIPKNDLYAIWDKFIESKSMIMQWNPYGGKMAKIPSSATPFPHRAGNLFKIQYFLIWTEDGDKANNHYLNISRSFYNLMAPYASKSPRETFLNYRDTDIGANYPSNTTSKDIAKTYGSKYFKENFDRLVNVKTMVDPLNFFRYEQSIPTKSGY